jgi:hypothetical protein
VKLGYGGQAYIRRLCGCCSAVVQPLFSCHHETLALGMAELGGSNSSRHYIFKQDLQALVKELGIEIRIAHYPPYTSKAISRNKFTR